MLGLTLKILGFGLLGFVVTPFVVGIVALILAYSLDSPLWHARRFGRLRDGYRVSRHCLGAARPGDRRRFRALPPFPPEAHAAARTPAVTTTDASAFDKLRARIQALRAKTIDNGCTEGEALAAAAKVAELLDRYELSLTDIEIRETQCEERVYQTRLKKRIPIDECIGAIASFCDCRVWREKNAAGEARYVFFGLPADVEVAHYLIELIDGAVRAELGRYKVSADYKRFRHQERHLANSSFALGMCASIADRLVAMKAERDGVIQSSGRGLIVLKAAVVDSELERLGLKLRTVEAGPGRFISPDAYDAGGVAGGAVPLNPAICRK